VKWDAPLLVALTNDGDVTCGDVHVTEIERTELADAQSGAVEQLAYGPIAQRPRVVAPVGVEQGVEILAGHHGGQPPSGASRRDSSQGFTRESSPSWRHSK
jgi:hypothetical protein